MFIIIGSLNINRKNEQKGAIILNDIILVSVFLISIVNVIISAFGMEHSSKPLEKIRNWTESNQVENQNSISTIRYLIPIH